MRFFIYIFLFLSSLLSCNFKSDDLEFRINSFEAVDKAGNTYKSYQIDILKDKNHIDRLNTLSFNFQCSIKEIPWDHHFNSKDELVSVLPIHFFILKFKNLIEINKLNDIPIPNPYLEVVPKAEVVVYPPLGGDPPKLEFSKLNGSIKIKEFTADKLSFHLYLKGTAKIDFPINKKRQEYLIIDRYIELDLKSFGEKRLKYKLERDSIENCDCNC